MTHRQDVFGTDFSITDIKDTSIYFYLSVFNAFLALMLYLLQIFNQILTVPKNLTLTFSGLTDSCVKKILSVILLLSKKQHHTNQENGCHGKNWTGVSSFLQKVYVRNLRNRSCSLPHVNPFEDISRS